MFVGMWTVAGGGDKADGISTGSGFQVWLVAGGKGLEVPGEAPR